MSQKHSWSILIIVMAAGFVMLSCSGGKSEYSADDFGKLAWMTGKWGAHDGDEFFYETWVRLDDTTLGGEGVGGTGVDTTFTETLRLLYSGGEIYYVALPEIKIEGVAFRLIDLSDSSASFENASNDFPTRIIYTRLSADSIRARLEGGQDGGSRSVEFNLERQFSL